MGWSLLRLILLLGLVLGVDARAAGPGDDLLALVPADSGVTLAVENLRENAKEIVGSPLFERLKRLPSVRNLLASEGFRNVNRGSREVMTALGVSVETLRDEVLGDAVILAFQPGPANRPDLGRGLLLVRPRDRAMVATLLKTMNEIQTRSGELAVVEDRPRGPITYKIRKFKAANRPMEYYVQLDDGTFGWSNSETMIQEVIDRKLNPGTGLGNDPTFRKVRRGLPDRPFLSLFVNPRLFERMMAENSPPAKPDQDRQAAMLARYVGSISLLGLSLEVRNGFHLHAHEVRSPDKLDPWLKRWLTRPVAPVALPASLPPTAVAVVSANLDFEALRDAAWELTSEQDRPSMENYKLALQGLLLGRDPSTEILPRLGPGALLYLDIEPNRALKDRFPLVGVVGWSDQPGGEDLVAPLDNALRTAFAIFALDPKRRATHLRVESRNVGDSRLTLLTDGLRTLASYRLDRNRLVLSNSPEAVARFGSGQAPAIFSSLRSQYFPEAETFAIIDVRRLVEEVQTVRGPLAKILANRSKRPIASVDQDLTQLINLAEFFQAATFSNASTQDATEVHRSIRLIAR
jgi:hypothetical protein